jgi:hypothetical protein
MREAGRNKKQLLASSSIVLLCLIGLLGCDGDGGGSGVDNPGTDPFQPVIASVQLGLPISSVDGEGGVDGSLFPTNFGEVIINVDFTNNPSGYMSVWMQVNVTNAAVSHYDWEVVDWQSQEPYGHLSFYDEEIDIDGTLGVYKVRSYDNKVRYDSTTNSLFFNSHHVESIKVTAWTVDGYFTTAYFDLLLIADDILAFAFIPDIGYEYYRSLAELDSASSFSTPFPTGSVINIVQPISDTDSVDIWGNELVFNGFHNLITIKLNSRGTRTTNGSSAFEFHGDGNIINALDLLHVCTSDFPQNIHAYSLVMTGCDNTTYNNCNIWGMWYYDHTVEIQPSPKTMVISYGQGNMFNGGSVGAYSSYYDINTPARLFSYHGDGFSPTNGTVFVGTTFFENDLCRGIVHPSGGFSTAANFVNCFYNKDALPSGLFGSPDMAWIPIDEPVILEDIQNILPEKYSTVFSEADIQRTDLGNK